MRTGTRLKAEAGFPQKKIGALNSMQRYLVTLVVFAAVMPVIAPAAFAQDALDSKLGRTISVVSQIRNFAVSPDGKIVAAVTRDDTISFFESDSGKKLGETPRLVFRNWLPLEFSPDSNFVACRDGFDATIRIWDSRTGSEHATLKLGTQAPRRFIFSPDSTALLVASGNEVVLWSLATKAPSKTLRCPDRSVVMDLAWLADGKRVVTGGGGSDKTARVWDLESAKELQAFANHTNDVSALACSSDDGLLVTLSSFELRLYDLRKGGEVKRATVQNTGKVKFTHDSKYVVVGATDNVQEFRQTPSLEKMSFGQVLEREKAVRSKDDLRIPYHAVAFSDDGRWVACDEGADEPLRFFLWSGLTRSIGTLPVTATRSGGPQLVFSQRGGRLFFRRSEQELVAFNCEVFAEAAERELAVNAEKERLAAIEQERQAKETAAMAASKAQEERRVAEDAREHAAAVAENAQPRWPKVENLDALLNTFRTEADGPTKETEVEIFEPARQGLAAGNHRERANESLREFILYGTAENARKAAAGDRFDKEDAVAAARDHQAKLNERFFYVQCKYAWDEKAETGPNAIMIRIPLPFRCQVPGRTVVGTRDIVENEWWYLVEQGRLLQCATAQEAAQREQNGQEIYLPENAYSTTLTLRVDAPREVLKSVARDPAGYVVNVGVKRLRLERPMTLGLFRLEMLRLDQFDTTRTRGHYEVGLNGPEGKPNYFLTKQRTEVEDAAISEAVMCDLDRLEIVRATPDSREVVFEWSTEGSGR